MEKSVYETPTSNLLTTVPVQIPGAISKKIKRGWIAAVISGTLTLGVTILAITTGALGELFDIWTMVDVFLIFLFAFGIYKKSRVAATLMLVYFIFSKIWIFTQTEKVSGLGMSAIFLYFYAQAMIGTYQYQKLIKSTNE